MTEINVNSLDELNSTLVLTENDSAELDIINHANLFFDTQLSQLNLIGQSGQDGESFPDLATQLGLENLASTSTTNQTNSNNILPASEELQQQQQQQANDQNKPSKRVLRQNSSRNANELARSDPNSQTSNDTTTVKEEPIVIIDDKDNSSSLIDLTKENDDVVIVNEVNCTNSNRSSSSINTRSNNAFRRQHRLQRPTIRKLTNLSLINNIAHNLNPLPTTSASANSSNDVNNVNDMEIIQEVSNNNNDESNKQDRRCVDITYHFCTRNNTRLANFTRPSRNPMNSTIVLDDERNESTNEEQSSIIVVPSTVSPSPEISSANSSAPKRLRLDKHKKDNPKQAGTTSVNDKTDGSESSIHCPICLETLAELKANKKRLKSTLCGHILCNLCLDATFKSNGDSCSKSIFCPTCRTKLTKAKIHDLYL